MNYNETKEVLKNNLWAKIPLIAFMSFERQRSLELIKEVAKEISYELYIHSMTMGMINIKDNMLVNQDKTVLGALDFIARDLEGKSNMTYVLCDAGDLTTSNTVSRFLLDLIGKCEKKNSTIIILANEYLREMIAKHGSVIELSLPDEEEIVAIVKKMVAPYQNQIRIDWNEDNYKEAGVILNGLSQMEIKNIIAMLMAKKELTKEDLTELNYAKDSMFNNINGLEKINVPSDLSFAGLENLHSWLKEKEELLYPSKREEMRKRGMKPPRGILLVGVPGCGKSLSAKVVSFLWKLPLYRLDLATVQGMYVGQSEAQLKAAFDAADHVAPCILWIDEIEKGLAVSGESNVTNKLIGQFLYWLQESDKHVFIVATANDVSKLPSELLRKGRFDELFFVDLPNKTERTTIINMYVEKYLRVKLSETFLNNLVLLSDKFTSADIEYIIRDIAYKQMSKPNFTLNEAMMMEAFKSAVSLSNVNPEAIDKIRGWGKDRTIPASIPEN